MKQVLITGANGQLGSALIEWGKLEPDFNCIGVDYADFDLTDLAALEKCIRDNCIDILINCAAYTDVSKAESEPDKAIAINCDAVTGMAALVKQFGLKWIHISTDYVFDGTAQQPYRTNDIPNPQNVYGKSKWLGEKAIIESDPDNTMILRTSWLYAANGKNFVNTIVELSAVKNELEVVSDQVGSPTFCDDLAMAIWTVLPRFTSKGHEIYHYTNSSHCSWFEFAQTIVKYSGHNCKVIPKKTIVAENEVKRPKFSVLDTEKIQKAFAIEIPHWETSLRTCLTKKVN